jgi:hypothetical protein
MPAENVDSRFVAWAGGVNLVGLMALTAWILIDPGFERFGDQVVRRFADPSTSVAGSNATASAGGYRLILLGVLVALGGATLVRMTIGLVRGSPRHRTLRRWFIFVTLLCMWITLGRFWRDLGWTGKAMRLRDEIASLQSVVDRLHGSWPKADGDDALLGAYSAYPPREPSMLLLLTAPELAGRQRAISAVERTPSGAICFELSGSERGDWLQWHAGNSLPSDFRGGLDVTYELVKYRHVRGPWYLVRYRSLPTRSI